MPLLDIDYSEYLKINCNQHEHDLDAIMNKIDSFEDKAVESKTYRLTNLENALFLPVGMYVGSDEDIPIVLDSGCSVAVTPNKYDLYGLITLVKKTNDRIRGICTCGR